MVGPTGVPVSLSSIVLAIGFMCGICGILSIGEELTTDHHTLAERMNEVLKHRGPSDSGTYIDSRIALGHRRLAVIDLSRNGRQPMSNEDETVWVVYNGEVYNFAELRRSHRLDENGHVFRSRTDTEVLVHLYEELGPSMVDELVGMFALAIWDTRTRELHLMRDRYGIKPLFYSWQGNQLLFGSEIKSILEAPYVPRRVNLQALHDFLSCDYVPGNQTMFEGIQPLPPAHRMCVAQDGSTTLTRYWDLKFNVDNSLDARTAANQAAELMERSVQRRLIADVPVGVLLSGGMDSSTVVALMSQHHREPIHTYSVGFQERSFDELPYARQVSERFGTIRHETILTPDLVREVLPGYLRSIDEPYADGSAIPTYYLCQLAQQDVVVVLSGEGGDEAFVGYDTYAAFKAARWARRVPRWLREYLFAPLIYRLPVRERKLSLEFRLKRFLGGLDLPPAEAHFWWRIVLTESEKRRLYAPAVADALRPESSVRHFEEVYDRSGARDVLNRLLHIDSAVFLPNDLMIKTDRMSMAHSIEARVPFTDHELTGFLARVSPNLKFPRLRKKHLMREAMSGKLPSAIINKKKIGLEIPYSRWLKHELKDVFRQYCNRTRLAETGFFRPDVVENFMEEHTAGRRDHGRALWGLLNFMMWLELYLP